MLIDIRRLKSLLLILALSCVQGCGSKFVDLHSEAFVGNKISEIEIEIERDQILVHDKNGIGITGSLLLGWPGMLVGNMVQASVDRKNELELDPIRNKLGDQFLNNLLVNKLKSLEGTSVFAEQIEVISEKSKSLSFWRPRVKTRFIFSPDKGLFTLFAHIEVLQNSPNQGKFNKTYISLHALEDYGLSGSKDEILEALVDQPSKLSSIVEEAVTEVVELIRADTVKQAPTKQVAHKAEIRIWDLIHLKEMEVVAVSGSRSLLHKAKLPSKIAVWTSSSLLGMGR